MFIDRASKYPHTSFGGAEFKMVVCHRTIFRSSERSSISRNYSHSINIALLTE